MKTIKIRVKRTDAIDEWQSKEYGSWEDHDKCELHACAILKRWKKYYQWITLTEAEAKELLQSGNYQSTSWLDDEIEGGRKTKLEIAVVCQKIRTELTKLN